METHTLSRSRARVYLGLGIILSIAYVFLRKVPWQGSTELHTNMEVISTFLALFVGMIVIIHFHAMRNLGFFLSIIQVPTINGNQKK